MLKVERLKEKQVEIEKRRQEYMGRDFYDLKDGSNVMRILPRGFKYFSKEGDDDFAIRYFVHYNMFTEEGFRMIVCRKTVGEKCAICEMVDSLDDKAMIGKLRARERFMYNVLDLKEGKMKILETGPKIYEEILKFVLNPEWGDLFGVKDGRQVTIEKISAEKSGTGWADYNVVPSPQKTDISDVLPEGWDDEIDKLLDRVPVIPLADEGGRLVDCFKEGSSPVTAEIKKREGVGQDRKIQLGTKEEKSDEGKPECFGLKYAPRNEKCKTCKVRDDCRTEFLRI